MLLAGSWGGTQYPWASPQILGLAAAALVLGALTVAQERRAAEPILPLGLFTNRVFAVCTTMSLVIGVSMFGAIVFLPLFLQVVSGASATNSGLLLVPLMVGVISSAVVSGRRVARTGRYRVFPIAGTLVTLVGFVLLSTMGVGTSLAVAGVWMLIVGAGIGLTMQVLVIAAQNAVDYRDLGVATSTVAFFRSLGGAVGVALFGAILANLLLALGIAFLLGGIRYWDQKYNPTAARIYSSMMLLAAASLAVPSAFSRYFAPEGTIRQEELLSLGIAGVLLLTYGLYLLFSLKTHRSAFASVNRGEDESHDDSKRWSMPRAVFSLAGASALAAWMSEILVGVAEGTGKALGMSQIFIGIVFLAIIGGAAESGSAVALARKDKMDLSVGIALGSSIQIALFVAPVLVFASYLIGPQPLELSFGRAEVGSLFIGVFIGTIVCGDGHSNWFKGVQLVTVYIIIATMFYFLPELHQ